MQGRIKSIIAFLTLAVLITAGYIIVYNAKDDTDIYPSADTKIELYGESHGLKKFYDAEYSIWKERYDDGQRILFMEIPFSSAKFLNMWLKADNDEILDMYYKNLEGTLSHRPAYLRFLKTIKENCPDTIIIGTDVDHQYDTTGKAYLEYLESNGLKDSEDYTLAEECIKQGEEYYSVDPEEMEEIREDYMISNFLNAYERVGKVRIMGIYGSYHTNPEAPNVMIAPIIKIYGSSVSSVKVSTLAVKPKNPLLPGFCVSGLVFLLMLFIPNIFWTKNKPIGYENYVTGENKVLLILERVGEVLVTCSLLIFKCLDPLVVFGRSNIWYNPRIVFWILAFVLMILYECYWFRYFASPKFMKDYYSSFLGFPVAGATLPVLAVLVMAIYGRSIILFVSGIILGIGHIGIHVGHYKEAIKER